MKRFQFQLAPVLDYKQQVLDSLMVELGAARELVHRHELRREAAYRALAEYNAEYARRQMEGQTVLEALECQNCIEVLENKAKREDAALAEARRKEEAKRLEVVEARKETYSLEKLKDIRRKEYDSAIAKAEERTLEDQTAARRAMERAIEQRAM